MQEILDERSTENRRLVREQMGIIIILSHMDLLKKCVDHPHFSCDGTFNMVTNNGDDVNYELVSIITKDPLTGRMYCPMRMIASRKTTAARIHLFKRFVSAMRSLGLTDPLTADPYSRLTIATDFETTFAVALGKVLVDEYRPDQNLAELPMRYVEKVCFGCSVHAKRIILEKFTSKRSETCITG